MIKKSRKERANRKRETVVKVNGKEEFIVVKKNHPKLAKSSKKMNSEAISNAIANNDVNELKKLHKEFLLPFEEAHVYQAIDREDGFEVLNYIVKNDCPKKKRISYRIAGYGNLDLLTFIHKNEFEMDEWIAHGAVPHIDCFQYLIDNDYPYDKEKCMTLAHIVESSDFVEYLKNL